MRKSACELLLQTFPKIIEFADLRLTYIGNCVVNIFLSYTAVMLNIVTIHAIRKTSSLPKTLKTLLVSLAVSDVGVGLLGQPFYTSLLVKWLQQNNPGCNIYMVFIFIMCVFLGLFLECCGSKCRRAPSYSSSSQISGTCDSKACCCRGDLNMAA